MCIREEQRKRLYKKRREGRMRVIAHGDKRRQVASGVYKRREGTMIVIPHGDKRRQVAISEEKRLYEKRR